MSIQAYILIQTEVGKATSVANVIKTIPGVSLAEGVTGPYDVIIAKGVMMHTIQIKSTFGSSKTRSKWTVSRGANHNKSYHRGVDFFAFYCDHTKVWRFIRQSRIAGRKTYSIRYDENKTKNNWHELENND